MKSLFVIALVSIVADLTNAGVNSLSAEKFKAVADAAVSQHVINDGEYIRAIYIATKNRDSETFLVMAIDSSGQCYSQAADVYVSPETSKIIVNFPRVPRQACQ